MNEWTPAMVEARLREAMSAGSSVTGSRRQAKSHDDSRLHQVSGIQRLDRTTEALSWLAWLEPEDARIVCARAEGSPWKLICWRSAVGRATAHRRWQYGLSLIAWRLNGRQLPAKRSRRRFLELARTAPGT